MDEWLTFECLAMLFSGPIALPLHVAINSPQEASEISFLSKQGVNDLYKIGKDSWLVLFAHRCTGSQSRHSESVYDLDSSDVSCLWKELPPGHLEDNVRKLCHNLYCELALIDHLNRSRCVHFSFKWVCVLSCRWMESTIGANWHQHFSSFKKHKYVGIPMRRPIVLLSCHAWKMAAPKRLP